jgi:thiamine biosynthesis lipoprotein
VTTAQLRAWRTELVVEVRAEVDAELLAAVLQAGVAEVDAAASRFRPDSEVSRLHASAGSWVPVSPLLLELLGTAKAVAGATQGLVHPGLGQNVAGAGYDRWAHGDDSGVTQSGAAEVLPWESIEIDPAGAVRIPPGMVLDLGASAKAWLADRLAHQLADACDAPALANLGGDISCVSDGEPWPIALDPELPGVEPVVLAVGTGGIATSGRSRRSWDGGHHIIDPRTGTPSATTWWSVSVIAADAVGANAATTAAMVLGEAAPQWLREHGVTSWLVGEDGSQQWLGAAAEGAA